MNLRDALAACTNLQRIDKPVSSQLEAASIIAALDGSPVLFTNVDNGRQVVSGICASRALIAQGLGISEQELLRRLANAMQTPLPPPVLSEASCQEVVNERPDLYSLPILKHLTTDGGPYITAGIAVINDPDFGRNISYHRMMVIGPKQLAVRLVEGRGTHTAWCKTDADLPIAVAISSPLSVLLAAAMSPAKGVDELVIANAISETPLVHCRTVPLDVPAEAEIIIEGRLTHRMVPEGPFIDLTETWDYVREQPVLEVDCITHRHNPIYHAILPGLSEHKTVMGLPREPGILNAVGAVCDVLDVRLSRGSMSWLHALVQIRKRHADDGPKAIQAAIAAHPSVKAVIVVDEDVPIANMDRVEWAIATRVQASRDLYIYRDLPSSSLDPSAKHAKGKRSTSDKVGIDATIPWPEELTGDALTAHLGNFQRIAYPQVNLKDYLPDA